MAVARLVGRCRSAARRGTVESVERPPQARAATRHAATCLQAIVCGMGCCNRSRAQCQQNRGFRCSTQSRRCAGEAASSVLDRGGGRCGVVASNAWAPELVGRVGWILVSGRITLRHTHGDGLLQREIQPGQSLNRISDSQCLIGWFQALVLRRHACSLASRGLRPGEPSPLRDRLGWPYALPHTWPPVRMQGCGDAGLYPVYKPASR